MLVSFNEELKVLVFLVQTQAHRRVSFNEELKEGQFTAHDEVKIVVYPLMRNWKSLFISSVLPSFSPVSFNEELKDPGERLLVTRRFVSFNEELKAAWVFLKRWENLVSFNEELKACGHPYEYPSVQCGIL